MNTLIEGYSSSSNDFQSNYHSNPPLLLPQEHHVSEEFSNGSSSPSLETCSSESEAEIIFERNDNPDVVFKFISDMLMEEEDLVNRPCMLNDCLALQATEKSLLDVLNNSPIDHFTKTCTIDSDESFEIVPNFESTFDSDSHSSIDPFGASNFSSNVSFDEISRFLLNDDDLSPNNLREKKNRYRDDIEEQRINKHLANNVVESEPLDMFDKVLLCLNPASQNATKKKKKTEQYDKSKRSNRGRPKGGQKEPITIVKEVVDLRNLLMQCAQALSTYETRAVNDILVRIRHHSSPHGDGIERLAHYFANALEARLAGNGTGAYFTSTRISAADILKAYKTFITNSPFRKMSNMMANRTIKKLAAKATTLHIIDFGILYGFQWPCLIHALSERPGGPPKLRITGIDFPQPGFRPAERVEETGRRLAKYCERFGVPFEYIAIAQKWETIKVEDVKIGNNELTVVNSVHRLHNVLDETVTAGSPRDAVLKLIRDINPDMFIHGVLNATYNTPFFSTRFREALFHFSSLFDMFEATVAREDNDRVLFEEEVYGKDAMNIIACEGTERIDRPETYKQWQTRIVRSGFRQMELDQELVKYVRKVVKMDYHKDFLVDEDGKWMLHGWKGRVIYAISCWKPAHI